MSVICFIDSEATGLRPDDEIWEFAARRRNTDGATEDLHLFITHDEKKAQQLPVAFYRDWLNRYPSNATANAWKLRKNQTEASRLIQEFTMGAHIVGAVPSFDTEKLGIMMRAHGFEPKWHYHLIDVENVVVGFLAGQGKLMPPPWNSDELSRAVGVDPEKFERHTAMGDVLWAEAQFDAVMGSIPTR